VDEVGTDEAGRARDKTFHNFEKPDWNLTQRGAHFHKKNRARPLDLAAWLGKNARDVCQSKALPGKN
jgi:hypothetical protein